MPVETGPQLQLRGIGMRFAADTPVLQQIDLTIHGGELIAFIGPSGCGKSTLLRLIAGLVEPTAGSLHPHPGSLSMAFIFQDPTLLQWADVLDNIALPLRIRGVTRKQRREQALQWGRQLGLDAAARFFPHQLSGGMRMRVSLARALITRPRVLLLDEPYAALDAISRNHLNHELRALHAAHRWTACFVTHSVSEAAFLADRIVVLSHCPGSIADVVTNPLPKERDAGVRSTAAFHQFVADLTGLLPPVTMQLTDHGGQQDA